MFELAPRRFTRRGKRATGQEEIGVAGAQLRPPPVSAPQLGCVLINPTQCRVGVTQISWSPI